MTRILPLTILTLFIFSTALAAAPQEKGDPDSFVSKHKESQELAIALENLRYHGFTGSVIASVKGDVRVAMGVGFANRESKTANTANTLHELASVTKQFTGAAICLLMDSKKLRLKDSIAKHLPGVPDQSKKITIQHLLNHSSGIPGSNSFGAGFELKPVVASFLKGGPRTKPGDKYEYWNQGYALLAGIIQTASGQTYPEFCREQLFEKAGMKTACFTGDQKPKNAQVATGYTAEMPPRSALDHPYREYGFQYQGMGGAVSNVWDLWRWNQALQKKSLLSSKATKELFKPTDAGYALGWKVSKKDGVLVQSHGGRVQGFVSEIRRYPKKDVFIAVLCNDTDAHPGRVADLIAKVLEEGKVPEIPRGLDAKMQEKLAGKYQSVDGHRLEIFAKGESTIAQLYWPQGFRSFGTVGTTEEDEVMFFPMFDPQLPKFEYGDEGKVVSIDFGYGKIRRVD